MRSADKKSVLSCLAQLSVVGNLKVTTVSYSLTAARLSFRVFRVSREQVYRYIPLYLLLKMKAIHTRG